MKLFTTITSLEIGFLFKEGEFIKALAPGKYFSARTKERIDVVSQRDVFMHHNQLDVIVASGVFDEGAALADKAVVLRLGDEQRALVWIDDCFAKILEPGLHVLLTGHLKVHYEVVDTSAIFFDHKQRDIISCKSHGALREMFVPVDHKAVVSIDGNVHQVFDAGRYVYWNAEHKVDIFQVDMREQTLDISGQELLTADHVSLRCNLVVGYAVEDVLRAAVETEGVAQRLYRLAQLALRSSVGKRSLEQVLQDKHALGGELAQELKLHAAGLGIRLGIVGVRDVILPGEMKTLLNQVTQARVAAEAKVIERREEVAAMRSQMNTAKMLESNPTLMRLHELEVVKEMANSGKLELILGNETVMERITKII